MNKNKKNNRIRNRLLAFSLAFALCMGAFAGFSITSHASADAYNQLKAGLETIKRKDSYDTEDVQYVWFDSYLVNHPYELYCLLEQLTEDEYNQLAKDMEYNALFHYSDDTYKWSDKPEDKKSKLYEEYGTYSECMKYVGEQKKKLEEEEKARQDAVSNATSQTDEAIPGLPNNSNNNNSNTDNSNAANNQPASSYREGSPKSILGTPNWADADSKEAMFGRIRGESWHWTAKELEEDGWLAPVGTQFWEKGDMIHYRVTKAGTGSTFGEVQIIGYESWDTPSDLEWEDATTSTIWAMNGPQRGIASNSTAFSVYTISNYIDDRRMKNYGVGAGMISLDDDSNRYTSLKNNKLAEFDFRMFAYCRYNHEYFIVTSIAPGAFKNRSDIRYAYIPDSVKEIPADCFKNCKNLKVVAWGSNALKAYEKDDIFRRSCPITSKTKKRIGKGAFSGCTKLKEFQLYGAYAEIKIDKNAFKKDKKQITVKTYEKGSYAKKFIKNISVKGKAKKEAKTKWGVPIRNSWDTNSTNEPIKGKSKKSSKKKK